jgi:hypothetical protein
MLQKTLLFSQFIADVQAGHKVAFASDSKVEVTLLAASLRKLGVEPLVATSDTVGNLDTQHLLTSEQMPAGYQVLLYSPTMGTGFSIDELFHSVYLFGSYQKVTDLLQMSYRVRNLSSGKVHWNITKGSRPTVDTVTESLSYTFNSEGNK